MQTGFDKRDIFRFICLECGHRASDYGLADEKDRVRNGHIYFMRCSKESCSAPHGVRHIGNNWVIMSAHRAIITHHLQQEWFKQHLR